MKTFEAKTIEEAVENASKELNVPKEEVHYIIKEEKSGILGIGKSAVIEVYTLEDVYNYGAEYLKNSIKLIGIDVEIKSEINEEGIIRMTINSERNPILIGHGGRTLRALNDLVRLATSNHFKRRYRILLDVGDYKDKKYSKIISIARRAAKEVSRQHIDVKLDAMTSDERRMIHQVLQNFHDVKTESIGEGDKRAVVIKYVGGEDHAFQTSEVYYKDIISDRPRGHGIHRDHERRPRQIRDEEVSSSLDNLLHKDTSFLNEDKALNEQPKEIREENKANEADKTIDDLPSASITTPIINTDALKDLTDKPAEENKPAEEKVEESTPTNNFDNGENK